MFQKLPREPYPPSLFRDRLKRDIIVSQQIGSAFNIPCHYPDRVTPRFPRQYRHPKKMHVRRMPYINEYLHFGS